MGHIHKLGLENFRIFKSREMLDFAPITILTGTNNSGKSTPIKCLQLLKASAAATGGLDKLLFTDGNHNLGTYQNARNNESDSDQITITLGIWLASANLDAELELVFWSQGENGENGFLGGFRLLYEGKAIVESLDNFMLGRINNGFFLRIDIEALVSKIRKHAVPKKQNGLKKGSKPDEETIKAFRQEMEYGSSQQGQKEFIDAVLQGNSAFHNFYPQDKSKIEIPVKENLDLNVPVFEVENEEKAMDEDDPMYRIITEFQSGFSFSFGDDYDEPSVQSNGPIRALSDLLGDLGYSSRKDAYYFRPRVSAVGNYLFNDVLSKNLRKEIDRNATMVSNLHHLSSIRASAERLYSNGSNSSAFNAILLEFMQAGINRSSSENEFLSKYLREFKLGDSVMIKRIEGVASAVYLVQGKKEILLADLGFGYTQLLPILLKIAIIAKLNAIEGPSMPISYNSSVFLLEEPEGNLHPSYQSKIADMIIEAAEKFNIQFIIETHSEYLIRKLQYHTATGKLKPNDTAIYYFEAPDSKPKKKKRVRKITIQKDGRLSAPFGEGFFDETPRLMLSIMNLSDEN